MNVVLFLGAGFSRAAGLPTMAEFFQHVRSRNDVSAEDKNFLRALQQSAQNAYGLLPGSESNLEHVLSFASMTDFEGHPETLNKLQRILQKVFAGPRPLPSIQTIAGPLTNLLGGEDRIGRNSVKLTIVTTNYDVLIDHALSHVGLKAMLPFKVTQCKSDKGSPVGALYREQGDVLICKLHGSLNWYLETESTITVEDRIVSLQGTDYNYSHWPAVCASNYSPPSAPFIIPPTYFKERRDRVLDSTWLAARQAIRTADQLVFIGYSFPSSDVHMRYFISSALLGHVDLEQINIIDPMASEICSRLETGQFGTSFVSKLRPIAHAWEKGRFRIIQ